MRKIMNKHFLGKALAGGLVFGILCTGSMWSSHGADGWELVSGSTAVYASEKEKTEEEASEKKVRPADYVITPQKTFSYGDMGLKFTMTDALLEMLENKELVMLPTAEMSEDGKSLKYGFVSWNTITEEQKEAEIAATDMEAYAEWMVSLGRAGTLGVFHKDVEKDLDKLTGCTDHKEIGKSEDEEFVYYLSTVEGADEAVIKEIEKTETEIKKMISYGGSDMAEGESLGTFTTEDVNGEEYTEEIFAEAELTMVNVFATWCSPCIDEIPHLAELDEKMKDKGVQVVGFVMDAVDGTGKNDEGIQKAQMIAEKTGAEYPFLLPDEGYLNGRIYNVQAVPETFFVDKNGNITGETYSGSRNLEEWEEIVEKELENLSRASEK